MTQARIQTASQKQALAPDAATLDERSVRAWTERMAVRRLDDGRYEVEGESDETYVVDLDGKSCTCPDHRIRGERCKHLRRVAIEINLGRAPPPGSPACRYCGAAMEADEVGSLPPLCPSCSLEPGEYVTDRETGDTLRVVGVRDRRADEVVIPELDTTVAEHETNRAYDPSAPVVDVTYPGASGSTRRTYSFPLPRLRRTRAADDEQQTLTGLAGRA